MGVVMDLETFCRMMYALCKIHGGSVTSWIRTDAHNKSLPGSVANSKHKEGLAVDVVFDSAVSHAPFIEACRAVKLRAFLDKDHVHVETI